MGRGERGRKKKKKKKEKLLTGNRENQLGEEILVEKALMIYKDEKKKKQ